MINCQRSLLILLSFATPSLAITATANGAPWWGAAALAVGQKSLLEEEEEATPPQPAAPTPRAPAAPSGGPGTGAAAADTATNAASSGDLLEAAASSGDAPQQTPGNPVADVVRCSIGTGTGGARNRFVKLLPTMIGPEFRRGEEFEFVEVDADGKTRFTIKPFGQQIESIEYYEERMLNLAAKEFGVPAAQLAGAAGDIDLSEPGKAGAAVRAAAILQTALAEHDSAVERYLRRGSAWKKLREPLSNALLNLQVTQARLLTKSRDDDQALAACDRMLERTAKDKDLTGIIRGCFEDILLARGERALAAGNYAECRRNMEEYTGRFPRDSGPRLEKLRSQITAAAQSFADRAKAENDLSLIDQAAAIWPSLGGLDELRRSIAVDYPVLHCAYASLPEHFSPFATRTPSERHASALLFESLVRWSDDPVYGARYQPQLSEGRPISLPRGRRFVLPPCQWSDSDTGHPHLCTGEDVVATVNLFKKVNPQNFPAAWGKLVRMVDTAQAENAFSLDILLERDHWHPLSLMDFPIVPKASFPNGGDAAELAHFDQQPIGTGPYQLASHTTSEVRFTANPLYRKPGLPKIREIRWHQLDSIEARDEFRKGKIQLVHGLRAAHVDELTQQGKKIVKLDARSVYFLAPNYKIRALANREFRMAIASAIQREAILTAAFRPSGRATDHAALSGPYLAGSWAAPPKPPQFSPTQAATFLSQAKEQIPGGLPKSLRLSYPDRDPDVGAACSDIKRQLASVGIQIELIAVAPNKFYDTVVNRRDFDLAYWRHDYEDETFWIWPLFDPAASVAGGSNFMHVPPEKQLSDLFHEMTIHKQFDKIQAAAYKVQDYIARNATIIPLWQLNTYVAVGSNVDLAGEALDPISLFNGVENWQLQPR